METIIESEQLTLGAAINRLLSDYGVKTVFGIPGTHNIELFRGLKESGIDLVLPRHEQGAGYMADGYARVSGNPGVCFVTSGPGLTNIMTPMGEAYADSVPMLVVSSVLPRTDDKKQKGILHEMCNQEAAAATVSALSVTADSTADVSRYIARAFGLFKTCRPRPVHIQVPLDLLGRRGCALAKMELPEKPHPSPLSIQKAVKMLNLAKRPVVIAGGGAAKCSSEIREVADILGASVLTTIAGKGIVADHNPRCLGAGLSTQAVHKFLRSVDVVLVVGSQLSLKDFQCDTIPIAGSIVRIDLDPDMLACDLPIDIPILSDAGAALMELKAQLQPTGAGIKLVEMDEIRQTIREEKIRQFPGNEPFMRELKRVLPDDAIISADMTEPAYYGNVMYPTEQPHMWIQPAGFGTLGYAVPAAIGAKIGAPKKPLIALIGDYGIQFTLAEIAVAVERNLSLPIIIWDNQKLWAIEASLENRGMPLTYSRCKNPDYQQMASAFGAHSEVPKSLTQMEEIIAKALKRQTPTLIIVNPDQIE